MNKEKAKQRLDALENEARKLRKIIDGSGFDWDFENEDTEYCADGDGKFGACGCEDDRHVIDYVNYFKTEAYTIKAARSMAWNNLLFKLAEHFNPEGWEWAASNDYNQILFDNLHLFIKSYTWCSYNAMTAKFHPDVVEDVIEELNNNKSKWWHLVTDVELVE